MMACRKDKAEKPIESRNSVEQKDDSNGTSSENQSDPDMFGGVHRSVLEAFDRLNWKDDFTEEEQINAATYWIPPDVKSESYAMKLLHDEFVVFPNYTIPLPKWNEGDKKPAFHLPGLKFNHHTVLPKQSVLDIKEQTELYELYCRISFKGKERLSDKELSRLQELRAKVAREYAEFQGFAKGQWHSGQWKRVLTIPPEVELYIDGLWKMLAGRCLSNYPDEYKAVKQLPLTLNDPNKDYSVFELVRHVLTKSSPLKMRLPRMKEKQTLVSNFQHLTRLKPVSPEIGIRSQPIFQTLYPVSIDHAVESILKRGSLDIDVVVSMSGIKTLIDNAPAKYQKEWILPITVKEVLKCDGETVKKVVIIDKKLPPKSMSVLEKNTWHGKIAAKWVLILSECTNLLKDSQDKKPPEWEKDFESFENLLNDVKKLKMEKSTGDKETNELMHPPISPELLTKSKPSISKQEPAVSHSTPSPSASQSRNSETRAKGGRVLTSYGDLPSDIEQPTNVNTKLVAENIESFKTSQQVKNEPLFVRKDNWAMKRRQNMEENNVTTRKRDRQSLTYDDTFAEITQDFEEFGVNPSPPKTLRTQTSRHKEIVFSKNHAEENPQKKMNNLKNESKVGLGITNELLEEGDIQDGEYLGRDIAFRPLGKKFIKPGVCKRMMKPCVQYQLWSLHKSNYIQFLKLEQRRLNVLVRTRKDGSLLHYENNQREFVDVCVSSKLEYQPEYGASKMNTSQLYREYLDLYLRPNCKLVRVRSIGHTKDVMLTELKTIGDIKNTMQAEGVAQQRLQKMFDPLYAVLTKLIDLAPGRYMLRHLVQDGPFATLLVEAPGMADFNLPQHCRGMIPAEVSAPPAPIDPLVITALQNRDHLPPALFIPKPATKSSCGNPERGAAFFKKMKLPQQKKRKRKGKKEKKNEDPPANEDYDVDYFGMKNLWPSQQD